MTKNSQNDTNDDQVLAHLYKEGAKETAPAKLNYEIINHAAKVEKPTSVNSHFGGGWKVPLSLAASIVVVFGLIVQIDQNPDQSTLPPIPEISAPTEPQLDEHDNVKNGHTYRKESDIHPSNDALFDESNTNEAISTKELGTQSSTTQTIPSAKKKMQSPQTISRDLLESKPGKDKHESSGSSSLEERSLDNMDMRFKY